MEVLEHRNSSDIGGSLMQGSLEVGVSGRPNISDTLSCGSQGLRLDMNPENMDSVETEDRQTGPLEVFYPGVSTDEQASSLVVAEAMRCQVKITTRRSLHLRIANHTARDVYVRLVGHGGRIAEINAGLPRNTLEQSKTGRLRQKCSHIQNY